MIMKKLMIDQVDLRVKNNFQNDISEIFSDVNLYRSIWDSLCLCFVFST